MNTAPVQSYITGRLIRVVITSFGYLHAEPPQADITLDVRSIARDPHISPQMRQLTGLDPDVIRSVISHPDAVDMVTHLYRLVLAYERSKRSSDQLVWVAIGCAGGRHRSVVIANRVAQRLNTVLVGTDVVHRDLCKPVVTR